MSDMNTNETPASSTLDQEQRDSGLDFSAAGSIGAPPGKPDPFYVRFGMGFLKFAVKLLAFSLGIVIEVLRAVGVIIKGIFVGIFKLFIGIGKVFRGAFRIFREVDWAGKLSFLFLGVGQIKRKQYLDGFVFLILEIAFLMFMFIPFSGAGVPLGINNLIDFFSFNIGAAQNPTSGYWDSVTRNTEAYVMGFLTIFIIIAFVILYVIAIKAMYDNWQITKEADYKQARMAGLNILSHPSAVEEDFSHLSSFKIRKLAREKYGYSRLASYYIARIPFKRINVPSEKALRSRYQRLKIRIRDWMYAEIYDPLRNSLLAHYDYFSPLERYLEYYPKAPEERYGREAVIKETRLELIKFSHKFDKYNDYLAVMRDYRQIINAFSRADLLYKALFAQDPVSIKNNEIPLPWNARLSVRKRVSSIVGAFELPLPIAKKVTHLAIFEIDKIRKKNSALTEDTQRNLALATFKKLEDSYTLQRDQFEDTNYKDVINGYNTALEIYQSPTKFDDLFKQGKSYLIHTLENDYAMDPSLAREVYRNLKHANELEKKKTGEGSLYLSRVITNLEPVLSFRKTVPFHGQPTRSLKRVKEFADEKFAITVLSLPTIACVVTVILPLVCSIFVSFTNWDQYHTNRRFIWSLDSFGMLFGTFGSTGTGSYSYTFFTLLWWTLIWAFFATFTNYFFGIILALIINRKSIKYTKVWRTLFVITIAVPQFISLLVMNRLLGNGGIIGTWLMNQDFYADGLSKFFGWGTWNEGVWSAYAPPLLGGTGSSANSAMWPKITIIIVNMWIGVPFTMLSTSGILMNIPDDLYESAQIDGAGPFRQLVSITMPYIFFVTGPSLITTFVGNINNFNVIYFLSGGGPTGADPNLVLPAGQTDLLITWLYKLTNDRQDYSLAAIIGLMVFIVCAFFSLIVYGRLGAVKNEEDFQ